MVLIHEFEDGVKFLSLEGSMPGTTHQYQGQEATAVGVCAALEPGDFITSTSRGHGHALARGLTVEDLLFELFGAATGCCRGKTGMRPIVDVQYGDLLLLAMDQIVNNAAKVRYMSGGTIRVPMVMRAPVGATGRGTQHAQNVERFFVGVPGIKAVAVSDAYDAEGVLKSAVRDANPVLIFEHKLLYGSKGAHTEPGSVDATSEVPEGDYTVPLDRAAVRRPGRDVTVLAWLLMAHLARQAAERLVAEVIDAEVIDVRSLSPIDHATIGESVRKTGRVVIIEDGPKTGGVGAEIAAAIMERFGESLLAPVARVASADVPVPFTPVLEEAYRPDVPRIVEAARAVVRS